MTKYFYRNNGKHKVIYKLEENGYSYWSIVKSSWQFIGNLGNYGVDMNKLIPITEEEVFLELL